MIPKVASHILQHTSRAAAAVQAQTTHSIRNALQLQSGTPGSSSSGWGSAGGAKQNAGSKFYGHTQTVSRVCLSEPSLTIFACCRMSTGIS